MKSWKTTTVGILGALIILLTQVVALIDSNPNTVFSTEALLSALGVLGIGWFARDNDKSSQDVGIR